MMVAGNPEVVRVCPQPAHLRRISKQTRKHECISSHTLSLEMHTLTGDRSSVRSTCRMFIRTTCKRACVREKAWRTDGGMGMWYLGWGIGDGLRRMADEG